jgi:bla regulator protein blaR1
VTGLLGAPRAAARESVSQPDASNAVFDSVAIQKSSAQGMNWLILKDGGLTSQGVSLRKVIAAAYGVQDSRVLGGPAWIDTPLYDIVAHGGPLEPGHDLPSSDYHHRIQALLTSRFGLLAHPDTQQLSVYSLHVDESGSKLKATATAAPGDASTPARRGFRVTPGELVATDVDVNMLTGMIDRQMGKPVLDKTGLTGRYDFTLTGSLSAQSLPALLHEQLGLHIEPATVPTDVIVVDQLQEPALDSPEAFAKLGGGVPPFPVPKI